MRQLAFVALVLGLASACGDEGAGDARSKVETSCTDGVDNDLDGKLDCDDAECAANVACQAIPVCGNNVREGDEICDGKDLAGHSCISRGFTAGTLRCDGGCAGYVTSACTTSVPEVCGNQRDDDGDSQTDCDDSDCANRPACMAVDEDCGAAGDEDGDGAANCADSDCAGEPACNGIEDCDNDVDDTDADTAVDCADSECATDPSCLCGNGGLDAGEQCDGSTFDVTCAELGFTGGTPTCVGATCTVTNVGCTGESCVDGADNDGDSAVDCEDTDCANACASVCGAPATLLIPVSASGTTVERASLAVAPTCAADGGAGPHIAYAVTPSASGRLRFAVSSAADVILSLRATCDDAETESQCVDAAATEGTEELFVDVSSTATFLLLVGGYGADDAGAFTIEAGLVAAETQCANLLDDDDNELIDCADPSCASTAACTPGTGLIDTACDAATDCAGAPRGPVCFSEEDTGFPGGACSEFCETTDECGAGAICQRRSGAPLGVCFKSCATDHDCRAGYACSSAGTSSVCVAYCTDDAQCSGGRVCNRGEFFAECTLAVEVCTDALDNDDDGLFDCDDQDCIDSCDTAGLTETEINDTIRVADTYAEGFRGEINPTAANGGSAFFDVDVVSFVVPAGGATVTLETDALAAGGCETDTAPTDTVVALMDGAGEILAYNDDVSELNFCSFVTHELAEGGTYYVQVEPYYSPDAGYVAAPFTYELSITVTP